MTTLTMDTDRAISTWRKATYAPLDASETCYVGSLLSRRARLPISLV